jgi:DNA-directed RNA polymerase specialized sigma24 family protein
MNPNAPQHPDSAFHATRWTLVMQARGDTPESRTALSELCAAYWNPVFYFLLREGRTDDHSRELAQEFFARLLARGGIGEADRTKGRFRSYLLGALKHFLAERRRNEGREKRGGDAVIESLDAEGTDNSPGMQVADPSAVFPDRLFDREWAHAIMERSLSAVQSSFEGAGKGAQFEVLKPWLVGDTDNLSQSDAAAKLGMNSGAIKVTIHRLRKDFRTAVEAEIAQTVPSPEDIAGELRYLVEVLS